MELVRWDDGAPLLPEAPLLPLRSELLAPDEEVDGERLPLVCPCLPCAKIAPDKISRSDITKEILLGAIIRSIREQM